MRLPESIARSLDEARAGQEPETDRERALRVLAVLAWFLSSTDQATGIAVGVDLLRQIERRGVESVARELTRAMRDRAEGRAEVEAPLEEERPSQTRVREEPRDDAHLGSRVLAILEDGVARKVSWIVEAVLRERPEINGHLVRTTLSRLANRGAIERRGWGVYARVLDGKRRVA